MNGNFFPDAGFPGADVHDAGVQGSGVDGSEGGGSALVEAGPPAANVILFPVRATPADQQPEERLASALEALTAAMAEQKAALAAWREALLALQSSTSGLGESLQQYQSILGTLGGDADVLSDRAVTMEQWADSVPAE